MKSANIATGIVAAILMLLSAASGVRAENGVLVLYVVDTQDRPLTGIRMTVKGDGGTAETKEGKARIPLAPQTRPKSWVTLAVLRPANLVFISPWDERTPVPAFENESQNYVSVVLAERGHRRLLEDPAALRAMVHRANQALAPKTVTKEETPEEQRRQALAQVAKLFGLEPEAVDSAIRGWGEKAQDRYDKGLAELYARNYPAATRELTLAVQMRREKALKAEAELVDADVSLGQSLYGEGKYKEAVVAYEEANRYRPDDANILNELGMSLFSAGDYAGADPLYRRALAIDEKAVGPDHPDLATDLNNLAELLRTKGDYAGAEPLFRRALAVNEKALGPEHPHVATGLNNLAGLLKGRGDYAGAEPLYRRALAIYEKALGPEHPSVATGLNNLAALLQAKGDYAGAEPLYRRALAIDEKALGPEHPESKTIRANLDSLLRGKGAAKR